MSAAFDPRDWYWQISTVSTTLVYGSARNIYVDPNTDTDYGNWVTAHAGASPYPATTEADVWYYTQQFMPAWYWNGTTMLFPAAGQYNKDQLDNYNAIVRFNHVNAGMTAAGIPVRTDDYGRGLIQGSYSQAQANANFTAQWFGTDGNFYTVDAAQMIQIGQVVGNHTNQCYTVFASTADGILTNTITQPSQIDDAYVGL
jgi:hypothetical protein